MGSTSTTRGDFVTERLAYLARETAEEAPEISAILLALAFGPPETAQEFPTAESLPTPQTLQTRTPREKEMEQMLPVQWKLVFDL